MRLLETLLVSFIFVLVYLLLLVYFLLLLENPKKIVYLLLLVLLVYFCLKRKTQKEIGSMAEKKLGEYAAPNDDYLRAPITQPAVTAENYEIKPHFLSSSSTEPIWRLSF